MRVDALDQAAREKVLDAARRAILRMSGAVNSLKSYPPDHPSLAFSHRGIAGALSEIHDLVGPYELHLGADSVTVGNLRAEVDPAQHPHLKDLVAWMRRRDAVSVRVEDVVTAEQVQLLLTEAADIDELSPVDAREQINRIVAEAGVAHLQLVAHKARQAVQQQAKPPEVALLESYLELCSLTEDLLVHGPRTGTLSGIVQCCDGFVDQLAERVQVVPVLLEVGQPLAYEARHIANMTALAVGIAARLGLGRDSLKHLAVAVATMDAGMTVLPAEVRRSGRELLPREVATLRAHPLESVRVHLRDRNLDIGARQRLVVAMEQHLGILRDGYPEVQRWPPLHLFSRIASVCDAYDALTSTTAWRRGLSPSQALTQLCPPLDTSHDPVIVAELCALLGRFPEACRVRLSSGQTAAVLQATGPNGLPVVRLEQGPGAGERVDLGLRAADGALVLTITEVLLDAGGPALG